MQCSYLAGWYMISSHWKKKVSNRIEGEEGKIPFLISFSFQSWAFLMSLASPSGFNRGPPGYLLIEQTSWTWYRQTRSTRGKENGEEVQLPCSEVIKMIYYPGSKPSSAASNPKNDPSRAWDPGLLKSMYLFISAYLKIMLNKRS